MQNDSSIPAITRRRSQIINDPVNHPSHYADGEIECIDAIRVATEDLSGFEGMLTGNAIKYLWRFHKKAKPVEDLEKAVWYLNKLIDYLKEKGETAV